MDKCIGNNPACQTGLNKNFYANYPHSMLQVHVFPSEGSRSPQFIAFVSSQKIHEDGSSESSCRVSIWNIWKEIRSLENDKFHYKHFILQNSSASVPFDFSFWQSSALVWCLFPLWTDEQYMWFCVTLCKSNQHSTNEMLEHCSLLSLWLLFSCVLNFCSVEL